MAQVVGCEDSQGQGETCLVGGSRWVVTWFLDKDFAFKERPEGWGELVWSQRAGHDPCHMLRALRQGTDRRKARTLGPHTG